MLVEGRSCGKLDSLTRVRVPRRSCAGKGAPCNPFLAVYLVGDVAVSRYDSRKTEADKRRKETKERLRQREREFAERQQPPLIVPELVRTASVGGFVTVEVSKSARTAQASA